MEKYICTKTAECMIINCIHAHPHDLRHGNGTKFCTTEEKCESFGKEVCCVLVAEGRKK